MRIKYLVIVLIVALFLTLSQCFISQINVNIDLMLVEGHNNDVNIHLDDNSEMYHHAEIQKLESVKEIISFLEMISTLIGLTVAIIEFRNTRNNPK